MPIFLQEIWICFYSVPLTYNNEDHSRRFLGEQFRNIESRYKLIDGVPETENMFNEIRKRKSYVMSFNHQTRNANWVYEILNRDTTPENPAEASPFRQTYHRGHLAAAANHWWCWEAIDDANVIDNKVPQHRTLNTGPWRTLERDCREAATAQNNIRNVHVYSGPLYLRDMVPRTLEGKRLPSHFFKVIIEENEDGTVNQLQCCKMPNGNLPGENLSTDIYRTIEEIQRNSGLTFIERRPNVGQNAIASEITVTLRGEDGNVQRAANIQVTTSPLV
uniref:Uncharacterized protein n=1 Tax=Sinocyclocheilus grahami TaxID=75366 RepID=A0A672Q688_SINGR